MENRASSRRDPARAAPHRPRPPAGARRGSGAAPDAHARRVHALERARLLRDADRTSEAFKAYDAANAADADSGRARKRDVEGARSWKTEAARASARACDVPRRSCGSAARRRSDAALRADCCRSPTAASRRRASDVAHGRSGEGIEFWRAVIQRGPRATTPTGRWPTSRGTSGFTFYRTAARETLGVRGWRRGDVTPPACGSDSGVRDARARARSARARHDRRGDADPPTLERRSLGDADRGSATTARGPARGRAAGLRGGGRPRSITGWPSARSTRVRSSSVRSGVGRPRCGPTRRRRSTPYMCRGRSRGPTTRSIARSSARSRMAEETASMSNARSRSERARSLPDEAIDRDRRCAPGLRRAGAVRRHRSWIPGSACVTACVAYVRWLLTRTDGRVDGCPRRLQRRKAPTRSPSTPPRCARRAARALVRRCSASTRPATTVKRILWRRGRRTPRATPARPAATPAPSTAGMMPS